MEEDNSQIKKGKSNTMENSSREELLDKCKSLVVLLKKAKASKDECTAELEKEKTNKAKLIKSFEKEKNQTEKELEALNEMVTNLSENKIDLVTKNESLHRQLQLQLSEVESLKNAEKILLHDRKSQQIHIDKQQGVIAEMNDKISKLKHQNSCWNEEKCNLKDEVQTLQEQIGQIEGLKGNMKSVVEENCNLKENIGALSKSKKELKSEIKYLKDELKAVQIVQSDITFQKKDLQENLKIAKEKIEALTDKKYIENELIEKLKVAEASLDEYKNELDLLKSQKHNLDETCQNLHDKINSYELKMTSINSCNKGIDMKFTTSESNIQHLPSFTGECESDVNYKLKYEELTSDNINKFQQIKDLDIQIQCLEQEIVQLKSRNESLQNTIAKHSVDNGQFLGVKETVDETDNSSCLDESIKDGKSNDKHATESLLNQISILETHNTEINSEIKLLRQETVNIIGLANRLFCNEEINTDSVTKASRNTYEYLEKIVNSFSNSDLEGYICKFSSNINQLLDECSILFNATEELKSECIVLEPIISILTNLQDLFLLLNKFFKFNLAPEFTTNIESGKLQANNIGKCIVNAHNSKLVYEAEMKKLLNQIEEFRLSNTTLNDKIQELGKSCLNYENVISESNKLKLVQEETIEHLSNANEELRIKLEEMEQEIILSNKKLEILTEEKVAWIENSCSEKIQRDKISEEKNHLISELKENMYKNVEYSVININEKINVVENNYKEKILEIQKLLSSKQDEVSVLEKRYLEIEKEMNETKENFKSLKQVIIELKISYDSFKNESQEDKKFLNIELDSAKNEKLKLEADLLRMASQLEFKINEESNILEINTENNNLKKSIITMESELADVKKDLESTVLLKQALVEECEKMHEGVEIACNKITSLVIEIEELRRQKLVTGNVTENELANLKEEYFSLKDNYESAEMKTKECEDSCSLYAEKICCLSSEFDSVRADCIKMSMKITDLEEMLKSTSALKEELEESLVSNESIRCELEELHDINLKKYDALLAKYEALNESTEILKDKLKVTENDLEKASEACTKTNSDLQILLEENLNLKDSLLEITNLRDELEKQLGLTKIELKKMKDEFSLIAIELGKTKEELSFSTIELEKTKDELSLTSIELEKTKGELRLSSIELEKTKDELSLSSTELEKTKDELSLSSIEIEKTKGELRLSSIELEKTKDELSLSSIELEKTKDENVSLNLKLSSLDAKQDVKSHTISEMGESQNKEELTFVVNDAKPQSESSSSHCKEILADLNSMNELLRERGEKISRLEDIIREKNREIDLANSQLDEAKLKMSRREEELHSQHEQLKKFQLVSPSSENTNVEELKSKVSMLEKEKEQLVKSIHSSNDLEGSKMSHGTNPHALDNQSEVMSTSTISKVEELHRMKELEDTFEERYMKLKSVAIKLKKKLAEQTAEMRILEDLKNKLILEKDELLKKSNGAISKNIQVLQAEIDRLQDNLDVNSKELKIRDKQLFSSAQEISDLKQNLASLQEENQSLSIEIKNLEEQLSGQESATLSFRTKVSSLEAKLESEEKKVALLEEKEKTADDQFQEISNELERVKQESKKHSLMDLEMKDYENIIEELTDQKNANESRVVEIEQQLDNERKKGKNLTDQIQFLQSQVESEVERAEKLKKMVTDYKVQLEALQHSQEVQMLEKEKDDQTIEILNQELEKLKIAMAELSVDTSKSESTLRKAKEMTEKQVEFLEEKIETVEKSNLLLTQELESLKKEFTGYKIRAQSVLRKKSTEPEGSLEQLKADREQLYAELESSHIKTHELQSEITAVKSEIGFLLLEKDRLSKLAAKLSEEIQKKEVEHQLKHESLEKKLESKVKEYQRIIANMSSQSEDMLKNLKHQEESQKESYCQDIQTLQSKLEMAEDKIWQLQNVATSKGNGKSESETKECAAVTQNHTKKHSHGAAHSEELSKVDISNMIREDGEGSEWVEPSHHRSPSHSRYSPPTLEQLINNPFPPQQSFDESASVVSAATDYTAREMTKLEGKVASCENRIIQLTTLLADSEAENAKLVQLSDVLKEEIRRVSRNESREKHLENNEYMKNVFLKFLSLKTGDEKFRLIPVMKTILQLSPEETKQLATIAKGDDGSGSGSQAWASYLHLWSGR